MKAWAAPALRVVTEALDAKRAKRFVVRDEGQATALNEAIGK